MARANDSDMPFFGTKQSNLTHLHGGHPANLGRPVTSQIQHRVDRTPVGGRDGAAVIPLPVTRPRPATRHATAGNRPFTRDPGMKKPRGVNPGVTIPPLGVT